MILDSMVCGRWESVMNVLLSCQLGNNKVQPTSSIEAAQQSKIECAEPLTHAHL